VTASNFRDAVIYPSGCFALGTSLAWLRLLEYQEQGWWRSMRAQRDGRPVLTAAYDALPLAAADQAAVGRRVPFFQDWLEHENPDDSWWEPVNFGRDLGKIPPASLVGGWYDIFLPSQLEDYRALREAGRHVRLTIGPWSHSSPGVIATSLRDGLEWFDAHLRETPEAPPPRPAVLIFIMGARRWLECAEWPPRAEQQVWYLGGEGTLGTSPPGQTPPDRYHFDPADPTPATGGPSLNVYDSGRQDQCRREGRSDVLTFTSAVLTDDVTVIGPLSADLHVRSSRPYCDFFVRLCDVTPNGRSSNLSDGIVRVGPDTPTRSDDGSFLVHVSMWPTANMFRRGHRIRLQVSSAAHPLFARNTGTGEALTTAGSLCAADQEVIHDDDHRSCLRMPVVDA
jgi:uncharacterized protein